MEILVYLLCKIDEKVSSLEVQSMSHRDNQVTVQLGLWLFQCFYNNLFKIITSNLSLKRNN